MQLLIPWVECACYNCLVAVSYFTGQAVELSASVGMGPISLLAECSLFTGLHNFGKKSHKNTVEVLILDTLFQKLQLCRWISIFYIIIKCTWLDSVPTHLIWMQPIGVFDVEHFSCWTNPGRDEVSGEIPIWPPQSVALNFGQPPQWHYTQCGPAVAMMFSSWCLSSGLTDLC